MSRMKNPVKYWTDVARVCEFVCRPEFDGIFNTHDIKKGVEFPGEPRGYHTRILQTLQKYKCITKAGEIRYRWYSGIETKCIYIPEGELEGKYEYSKISVWRVVRPDIDEVAEMFRKRAKAHGGAK